MDWDAQQQSEAIESYASVHGVTVFTDVPVTRPAWRNWPEDTSDRSAAVAVGQPGATPARVAAFDEVAFTAAIADPHPVRPLVARGYADRTVFGSLVTRQAFVERSWHPRGAVLPVALTGRSGPNSNVAPAYRARGFEIWSPVGADAPPLDDDGGSDGDGKEAVQEVRSNGEGGHDPFRSPKRGEDQLLHRLWQQRGQEGWWFAEVPVGGKSRGDRGSRRFDAVVIPSPSPRHSAVGADRDELERETAAGSTVELIEVKHHLTSAAIGQLLSGAHLFSASWPGHGTLALTLCVENRNDYALRWYCASAGIRVERV